MPVLGKLANHSYHFLSAVKSFVLSPSGNRSATESRVQDSSEPGSPVDSANASSASSYEIQDDCFVTSQSRVRQDETSGSKALERVGEFPLLPILPSSYFISKPPFPVSSIPDVEALAYAVDSKTYVKNGKHIVLKMEVANPHMSRNWIRWGHPTREHTIAFYQGDPNVDRYGKKRDLSPEMVTGPVNKVPIVGIKVFPISPYSAQELPGFEREFHIGAAIEFYDPDGKTYRINFAGNDVIFKNVLDAFTPELVNNVSVPIDHEDGSLFLWS